MRKIVEFPCSGEMLVGTIDLPAAADDDAPDPATCLLIVSGGNEVRAGAHRAMAMLARRLAEEGVPVFRFDRRGIGDSSGANVGYAGSRSDIEAAIDCFRRLQPKVKRIVAFGNCDAATALLLLGQKVDGLVLANPWLRDEADDLPSADAIRARYADRLRDPGTWRRALTGGVNFAKLASGLAKIASPQQPTDLEQQLFDALRARADTQVLVSIGDATGVSFLAAAARRDFTRGIRLIDTDSHSFARSGDQQALLDALRDALGE